MNDLKKHLQNERLQRVNRAWQYLTPLQRASIYIRAMWWSLPNIIQIVERIRVRVLSSKWLDRRYRAHWINVRR